ncbi:unnamed protein product [Adineta ricciae]|uniref:Methyltransferase FkbM domain-containing protein n=1 Tax=Adineta ricciae TaxID=249248 RepID=A0A814XST6_ADIRI|nr:unnamed protein product [Adineta ricciae]CAF1219899.1 unnamed protein product [Adineta ricciae]
MIIYTFIIVTVYTSLISEHIQWTVLDYGHYKQASRAPVNMSDYLHTPLSPGLQWCSSNPFLANYDRQTVFYMEHVWHKWFETELQTLHDILAKVAPSPNTTEEYIVDMIYPRTNHLPCWKKHGLVRYGKSLGVGKVLCGLSSVASSTRCIVYSLGSNNNFDSPPKNPIKQHTFHKTCMGIKTNLQQYLFPYSTIEEKINISDHEFKSFSQITSENNHTHVHVLKMDIEGGEYAIFADIFNSPRGLTLPYQISFESHWWNRDIYHATLHQTMFKQFWKNGYRILYHEVNPGDKASSFTSEIRKYAMRRMSVLEQNNQPTHKSPPMESVRDHLHAKELCLRKYYSETDTIVSHSKLAIDV